MLCTVLSPDCTGTVAEVNGHKVWIFREAIRVAEAVVALAGSCSFRRQW